MASSASAGDPYEILGVATDASPDEIKRAYRKLAHLWHPDKNASPEAEATFKRIASAWEVVGDPTRRRAHDLRAGRAQRGELPEEFLDHIASAVERAQTWIEEVVLPHYLAGMRGRGAEVAARLVRDQEALANPAGFKGEPTRRSTRDAARLAARIHVTLSLAPTHDLGWLDRTRDGRWIVTLTPWPLWANGFRDPVAVDDAVLRVLLARYASIVATGRFVTTDLEVARREDDAVVQWNRIKTATWSAVAALIAFMLYAGIVSL